MYTNSAYLHNSLLDIVDKSRPLIVTSCGTYKLYTQKEFTTYRPKGRKDYQLIYVAAGKAHFEINGQEKGGGCDRLSRKHGDIQAETDATVCVLRRRTHGGVLGAFHRGRGEADTQAVRNK